MQTSNKENAKNRRTYEEPKSTSNVPKGTWLQARSRHSTSWHAPLTGVHASNDRVFEDHTDFVQAIVGLLRKGLSVSRRRE